MGASSNPCRQSLSVSIANERLSPKIAANEIATHNVPGATSVLSSPVDSNAKLKTTSTRTANTIIDANDSLFRNSMATSLKMMADTGLILLRAFVPLCLCVFSSAQAYPYVLVVSLAHNRIFRRSIDNHLTPVHNHRPRRRPQSLPEIMRRQNNR